MSLSYRCGHCDIHRQLITENNNYLLSDNNTHTYQSPDLHTENCHWFGSAPHRCGRGLSREEGKPILGTVSQINILPYPQGGVPTHVRGRRSWLVLVQGHETEGDKRGTGSTLAD